MLLHKEKKKKKQKQKKHTKMVLLCQTKKATKPYNRTVAQYQNYFTELSSYALLPKLLKLFWYTEQQWRLWLKLEKKIFKRHLLGQLPDFKIISQKCSSYAIYQNFLKWFCSAEQDICQS